MYAKIKPESQFKQIGASDTGTFTKQEWRPVKPGFESDIQTDPDLLTAPHLEARVKATHEFRSVFALAGREYVKQEWHPVPVDSIDEARAHPYLEVREVAA